MWGICPVSAASLSALHFITLLMAIMMSTLTSPLFHALCNHHRPSLSLFLHPRIDSRGTGSGKFNYFPLKIILNELESIITILSISGLSNNIHNYNANYGSNLSAQPPRTWAARILTDIKCTKSSILSAYLDLLKECDEHHAEGVVRTGLCINLEPGDEDGQQLYEFHNNIGKHLSVILV